MLIFCIKNCNVVNCVGYQYDKIKQNESPAAAARAAAARRRRLSALERGRRAAMWGSEIDRCNVRVFAGTPNLNYIKYSLLFC